MAEIYRYLGYTRGASPASDVAEHIGQVLNQAHEYLNPRGTFSLYSVTKHTGQSLCLQGGCEILGNVGEFIGAANRVAVFTVTVGREISGFAQQDGLAGDVFAQWVADAYGSWAAEAAADRLMESVRQHAHRGEALTPRFSPGYCGMDMTQQRALFQMVQADAVGIKLLPSLLMYPLKSISGIVGIGPKGAVDVQGLPCDRCDRMTCHMRRASDSAGDSK